MCDRSDRAATIIIVANEVPMAICICIADAIVEKRNKNARPGTTIRPPPAPNKPDKIPDAKPKTTHPKKSNINVVQCIMIFPRVLNYLIQFALTPLLCDYEY